MTWDVIVAGGGAAGMVSALICGSSGLRVLLLEKNKKLGAKVLLTGAGRCNLLNQRVEKDCFPCGWDFSQELLKTWSKEKILAFFSSIGLETNSGADGRIFPITDRAQSVVDVFSQSLNESGVTLNFSERVESVKKKDSCFLVKTTKGSHKGRVLVLAMGGQSFGRTGSSGEGFALAKSLGHEVIAPRPALVALKAKLGPFHKLQGQKWLCSLKLMKEDEEICSSLGDVMWTNYGLSGLAILDITAKAARADYNGMHLLIDLFPHLEDRREFFINRARSFPKRTFPEMMTGLLPRKLSKVCLPLVLNKDELHVPASQLAQQRIEAVADKLSALIVKLGETVGWEQAQITAGGVDLKEVETDSCQSKLLPNLYLVGEVLNAHGVSGGYNLHLAWATALAAANHINKGC